VAYRSIIYRGEKLGVTRGMDDQWQSYRSKSGHAMLPSLDGLDGLQ